MYQTSSKCVMSKHLANVHNSILSFLNHMPTGILKHISINIQI